jgi:RimJ/RimL family protein N-acetyltransferase
MVNQAHRHGILGVVRDLGISLMSVSNVEDPGARPPVLGKVLRTARLAIRPPKEGDAAATWIYRRLESVSEWLTWLAGTEEEYTDKFVDPARLAMTAVVELLGSNQIVGDLMIKVEDSWCQVEVRDQGAGKQVEIGYCLDPRFTGQGYAAEAVGEVLRYCFEDLAVHRIVANCFADNEASWRLMERLGMRRESHAVADSLHRSGKWHDSYGYALLADEWRNRA